MELSIKLNNNPVVADIFIREHENLTTTKHTTDEDGEFAAYHLPEQQHYDIFAFHISNDALYVSQLLYKEGTQLKDSQFTLNLKKFKPVSGDDVNFILGIIRKFYQHISPKLLSSILRSLTQRSKLINLNEVRHRRLL